MGTEHGNIMADQETTEAPAAAEAPAHQKKKENVPKPLRGIAGKVMEFADYDAFLDSYRQYLAWIESGAVKLDPTPSKRWKRNKGTGYWEINTDPIPEIQAAS